MSTTRVPIFDRLPAIHRIRDAEQHPPDQLRAFVGLFERAFGEIHADIERLYHDLFIDTCADWVVPYLADLVGTSHLSGDPWTLRAEIADTIALRRRKGTRGAIELLAFDLTGWAVHAIELRERLVWSQHLNHQRLDRGGTAVLRDPAALSLLDTPFDRFAHLPDLRPAGGGAVRPNLPNLAIYTWRLAPYTVPAAQPVAAPVPHAVAIPPSAPADAAPWSARFEIHPMGEPVILFNRHHFDPDARPLQLGALDGMPGPIPRARLTTDAPDGRPAAYVEIDRYDPGPIDLGDRALQLHVPEAAAAAEIEWRFRGANLCAWELGLAAPLRAYEVVIDPVIGRLVIGAPTDGVATLLLDGLRVTHTYGAVGPIGAHPISRTFDEPATVRVPGDAATLAAALATAGDAGPPLVIELVDSDTHVFEPLDVAGVVDEGGPTIPLARDVTIRAAARQRPVIRLARPLAVRTAAGAPTPRLRLDGLYLTRGATFSADPGEALIRRAAIATVELTGCTLDPGGTLDRHGDIRAPIRIAIALADDGGDAPLAELHIRRSITGPLRAERTHRVYLTDSIVDAGTGPYEPAATAGYAIGSVRGSLDTDWGPRVQLDGVTLFGRTRVQRAGARGAIFAQPAEVLDDQHGCFKHCWMPSLGNRTPQRFACLYGDDARLRFISEIFGHPAYAQLADAADWRIRDRGPDDDHMGATGFLRLAHAVRNLRIRLRELMPVGVNPHLIHVT